MTCCDCPCGCWVTPGSRGNVESWNCHLHGEASCFHYCDEGQDADDFEADMDASA